MSPFHQQVESAIERGEKRAEWSVVNAIVSVKYEEIVYYIQLLSNVESGHERLSRWRGGGRAAVTKIWRTTWYDRPPELVSGKDGEQFSSPGVETLHRLYRASGRVADRDSHGVPGWPGQVVSTAEQIPWITRWGMRVAPEARSPQHWLAMRVIHANQSRSWNLGGTLYGLAIKAGCKSVDDVLQVCAEFFPGERVEERIVEQLEFHFA